LWVGRPAEIVGLVVMFESVRADADSESWREDSKLWEL